VEGPEISQANELWRPTVGYEGSYEVSDHGRVRSIGRTVPHRKTGSRTLPTRILNQRMTSRRKGREHAKRYLIVDLCSADHKKHIHKVHRLVLEAFVGPRPEGYVACHGNDDPTDNRLDNLRWDTRSANTYDAVVNGCHPQARKTVCGRGHEYTPENTYFHTGRYRRRNCRACQRERQQKYMASRP